MEVPIAQNNVQNFLRNMSLAETRIHENYRAWETCNRKGKRGTLRMSRAQNIEIACEDMLLSSEVSTRSCSSKLQIVEASLRYIARNDTQLPCIE